jgi:hypothetical protein
VPALEHLEHGPGHNLKINELASAWKQCQDSKDTQFGINKRRNYVDLQAPDPILD